MGLPMVSDMRTDPVHRHYFTVVVVYVLEYVYIKSPRRHLLADTRLACNLTVFYCHHVFHEGCLPVDMVGHVIAIWYLICSIVNVICPSHLAL